MNSTIERVSEAMRYKKEILIAGATAMRRERVNYLEEQQRGHYEEEEKILQQYNDDQPLIEKIAREILHKAENAEEITREYLDNAFKVPLETNDRYPRMLGLDKTALDKLTKKICTTENAMNALEKEPLKLVDFLNAIEDDLVSDYGIKAAGFTVNMADLLTKGLEELRREKDPARQAAEATS